MIPKLELHQLINIGFVQYLEKVVAPIYKDRQERVEKYIEENKDNLKHIMGDNYETVMKHASYVMGFDLTETKIYTKEMNENAFNPSKYLDANFLLAVDGQSN